MIQVCIADDHSIVREGLRRLINEEPDMRVGAEARDGAMAAEVVRIRRIDVLLLDLEMPRLNGLEAIDKIRRRSPQTRIVILTHCAANLFALKTLERGVDGFLSKDCDPLEVLASIRAVAAGRRHFSAEVSQLLVESELSARARSAPHEALNEREFQLLLRYARGQSTADIARELALSPRSVSTYHGNLLRKLGLDTRSELVHYAVTRGLVS